MRLASSQSETYPSRMTEVLTPPITPTAPSVGNSGQMVSKREADLAAQVAAQAEQMAALVAKLEATSSADDAAAREAREAEQLAAVQTAQDFGNEQKAAAERAMTAAKKNAALAYLQGLQKPEKMIAQFMAAVDLGDDLTLTDDSKAALDVLKSDLGFAFATAGRDGRTTPMGGAGKPPQYTEADAAKFRAAGMAGKQGKAYESDAFKSHGWAFGFGGSKALTPDDVRGNQ